MENVLEFIMDQKITYLATIERDQARVRPMGQFSHINGKLTFCTNNKKDVFKQMAANPKIEFCMFGAGKTVRLFGTIKPSQDESVKAEFLKLQPAVAKLYGGSEDILEIMVFEDAKATVTVKGVKEEVAIY